MNDEFRQLVERASTGVGAEALTRERCLAATRAFAENQRAAIRARHAAGESGGAVVRLLSEMADAIVAGSVQFGLAVEKVPHSTQGRFCVCALGGYGRAQMSPASDLDVCLLYEGRLDASLKRLNSFVMPFLWDSGFKVGYSLQSVRGARQLAKEDTDSYTSMLEARLLCGEASVFARMKLGLQSLKTPARTRQFIEKKVHERFAGLSDAGADLFAPQPNVKENAGGLRDCHAALWLLMMSAGVYTLEDAAAQRVITEEEHLEFAEAVDFIWRLRNELHFAAGSAQDELTYARQREAAAAFGYRDGVQAGSLLLMQDYYAAARRMRRFLNIVVRVCNFPIPTDTDAGEEEESRGYAIRHGLLVRTQEDLNWFSHRPARLVEIYWQCARHGVQLGRPFESLASQNLHLINDAFQRDDLVRQFFVALCSRPFTAGMALRQMANSGVLGAYVPEFGDVQGVIRYEDFHHYPVDEHTLRAVESLAQIEAGIEGPVGRCLREALENLTDPYIVVLAILCHDLGKAAGEVHVAEGVRIAWDIARRIGLSDEDGERIAFLVEHHMLMNNISQYRDVDDEDILQQFADTVRTEPRLRALFVLSFADLFAVGPNVWSEWKGALLMQLYLRTMKRFLGRVETFEEAFWTSGKAGEVRRLVGPPLDAEVEDHLKGLGHRYFLAFSAKQIARHIQCVARARAEGVAVVNAAGPGDGFSEFVVSAADRPGLFSQLAGTFSSQLIDVNSAALFTRPDGLVVDCFSLTDARQRRPLTHGQVEGLERVLRRILLEGEDVAAHVKKARQRLFALLQPRIPVPTRIEFDNNSSRTHTVVDIETGDRTGLLYDITNAIAGAGLDIAAARIVTDARRVRDSFYVTAEGQKLEQAQEPVRRLLHDAIHPRAALKGKGGTG